MTFLAKEYYADLMDERVTEDEFAGADREVCKRNRFFPLVADLLTVVEALRQTKVKRIDIEWKRNFPEVLSPDEARMLGVSQNEIDRAKREYLPDNSQLKRLISGIGGLR